MGTSRYSRLLFHDLAEEVGAVRGEGTAWMPHSVEVLRAKNYNFLDAPYIESIFFSKRSCPRVVTNFANTETSKSEVNFFVDEEKPECALPQPGAGLTFLNMNENCGKSVVPGERVVGLEFEPLCLVVLIAAESRKELFDQFLSSGRVLSDFFRISVNYTVALGQTPSVRLSALNCDNSDVLYSNYLLDTTLQAEKQELEDLRVSIAEQVKLVAFWQHVLDLQPASAAGNSDPAYTKQTADLAAELATMRTREASLVSLIGGCVSSRTHACGLSATEAPNPWVGADGSHCRGYGTWSTRELDYCGYWESDVRVLPVSNRLESEPCGRARRFRTHAHARTHTRKRARAGQPERRQRTREGGPAPRRSVLRGRERQLPLLRLLLRPDAAVRRVRAALLDASRPPALREALLPRARRPRPGGQRGGVPRGGVGPQRQLLRRVRHLLRRVHRPARQGRRGHLLLQRRPARARHHGRGAHLRRGGGHLPPVGRRPDDGPPSHPRELVEGDPLHPRPERPDAPSPPPQLHLLQEAPPRVDGRQVCAFPLRGRQADCEVRLPRAVLDRRGLLQPLRPPPHLRLAVLLHERNPLLLLLRRRQGRKLLLQ